MFHILIKINFINFLLSDNSLEDQLVNEDHEEDHEEDPEEDQEEDMEKKRARVSYKQIW